MRPEVPMRGGTAWRRTMQVKEDFLAAGNPDRLPPEECGVRREIVQSWRRSLLSGVDAAATDLPRDERAVPPDRLLRAAGPVVRRLEDELAGCQAWAFLADYECRLVRYVVGEPSLTSRLEERGAFPGARFGEDVVGTNGLGTAVEQQRPFIVAGSEHFRAYESQATTAGAPVRDPLTGRLVGLLNLNCPYEFTNGLLLPLVTELARAIEDRLLAGASAAERELLDEVVRASNRYTRPVIGIGREIFIANHAALNLLDGADHEPLRQWASDAAGRERVGQVRLSGGRVVLARCRPMPGGGAVVSLSPLGVPRVRLSPWQRLLDQAAVAGDSRLPVLFRGERGTGKTVLAQTLGPGCVLDAALGAGDWVDRLEGALADPTATVLLRHLDVLDPSVIDPVAALLASARARVIATASSSGPLPELLDHFPVVLDVPPLRERGADLPALVTSIIKEVRPDPPRPRCTPEALAILASRPWPGNVRELRQTLATALVRSLSCDITVDDLPGGTRHRVPQLTKLESAERQALVTALRESSWNREAAARNLGISRATIYRKLKRFGIHPPDLQ